MNSIENTTLIKSIRADLNPKDDQEEFQIIHTGISKTATIEETIKTLEKFKSEGYFSIKFISSSEKYQTVELTKKRTSEEIAEYRLYRVEKTILRWIRDGLRRYNLILKEKDSGITIYANRIQELMKNNQVVSKEMSYKFKSKQARADYYRLRISEMNDIISNYHNYTYEEICAFPDKFFNVGGSLK